MDEVEHYIGQLCVDVTKAALRSEGLDHMHKNPSSVKDFLAEYFEQLHEAKKHEASVMITESDVKALLLKVFVPAMDSAAQSVSASSSAAKTREAWRSRPAASGNAAHSDDDEGALFTASASTVAGPFVSQKGLRQQLLDAGINIAAMSEAVELCRLLDDRQQAKVIFGHVNLVHFVAVFMTLYPVRAIFELVELAMTTLLGAPRANGVTSPADLNLFQLFYCWSVIDQENREPLQELCATILRSPNLTVPSLLEKLPNVRFIGMPAPTQGRDSDTTLHHPSSSRPGTADRVVTYDNDDHRVNNNDDDDDGLMMVPIDTPATLGNASASVAVASYAPGSDVGTNADNGNDDDEGTNHTAVGDRGFWNALTQ